MGKHTRKWNNDFIALDLKFRSKTVYSTSFIQYSYTLLYFVSALVVCVCVSVCVGIGETMLDSQFTVLLYRVYFVKTRLL